MTQRIPYVVADFETQLSTAISIGATTFSISSNTDDSGDTLPNGLYCFTIDNGSPNKEYLIGTLTGSDVTGAKTVDRQGNETSGALFAHRVGASVIVTNFVALQRVADILRGALDLDGSAPIAYDTQPTLADGKELATVQYVLDVVNGGTVYFSSQTVSGTAGESLVAGDIVYFKTSDQRWWKTDADTAATVNGVRLGVAQGAASVGNAVTVQISGIATNFSALSAGTLYYVSNTAGGLSSSAGTTSRVVGYAVNSTNILLDFGGAINLPSDAEKAALAGNTGTPSGSNKYLTDADRGVTVYGVQLPVMRVYTTAGTHTWSKPANLSHIIVEVQAGGGGSGGGTTDIGEASGAGAGGGYSRKLIAAATLGASETVTVGDGGTAGGNGGSGAGSAGGQGGTSSFGSHASATGGGGGSPAGNGGAPAGGEGGIGSSGDLNIKGQGGMSGIADADVASSNYAAHGGSSVLGGGGQGLTAGGVYGGGAGGTRPGDNSNGLVGGKGVVVVTEYFLK